MAMKRALGLIFLLIVCIGSIGAVEPAAPVAPQKDHFSVWHGEKVNDPWFWLREKGSVDVLAYLNAENGYTEKMTSGLNPFVDTLYREMLGRMKQTDLSVPWRFGRYYYYNRTVEGQQYPIYCRKAAAVDMGFAEQAMEEILLDQNEMAKGLKFLSLYMGSVSSDEQKLLFCTDTTGFRQYSLFVKDLVNGQV
ncbi:MAG: oligopeptidase B, partial [Bacteroidales bacterium]